MADDNEPVVETWESLTDGRNPDSEESNQGGSAAPDKVAPPPATPSVAVAPNPADATTEATKVDTDPGKPAADAKPAGDTEDPAKVQPPVAKAEGEGKVDAKPDGEAEEEESAEDKAEFAGLPEKAQSPARRYRKESRQFRAFQTEIGGEDFLEDAKLIVPAFHTQPPEKFDEILISRSPGQRNQLYTHMVYTAINGADRPTVIKILAEKYKPELEAALGVTATDQGDPAKPETHVEPTAPKDFTAELATLDELLADQYITAEQTAALNAAKTSLLSQAKVASELDDLRKMIQEVKAKEQTTQGTTAEQETEKLGDEFLGEVWSFADTRLDELGLSAADGDSPEVSTFIQQERKRIRELLPTRFEAHENAKKLIGLLETKFDQIPKLSNAAAKEAEKKAAWRFMPPVKVCVDEILGKEVASCLKAIEAMRGGTQQAPTTQGQRKEIVGHEAPSQHPNGQPALVTGKGVDALWASLTGGDRDSLGA
jgi:hypothetical protein